MDPITHFLKAVAKTSVQNEMNKHPDEPVFVAAAKGVAATTGKGMLIVIVLVVFLLIGIASSLSTPSTSTLAPNYGSPARTYATTKFDSYTAATWSPATSPIVATSPPSSLPPTTTLGLVSPITTSITTATPNTTRATTKATTIVPTTTRLTTTASQKVYPIMISATIGRQAALFPDGTVFTEGRDTGSNGMNTISWRNIKSISAGGILDYAFVIGLKKDGTVVSSGAFYFEPDSIDKWQNIAAISAGWIHGLGLKNDGTVVSGGNPNNNGLCNEVSSWKGIVAIAAGNSISMGLKQDGTVIAVGSNDMNQCNVSSWKNIVAVAAGSHYTAGLKKDGTVIIAGDFGEQLDTSGWRGITAIAMNGSRLGADPDHIVGLKSDGTVVATGLNSHHQCDVSTWKDVIAISTGDTYTLGLKKDGRVLLAGAEMYGGLFDWRR